MMEIMTVARLEKIVMRISPEPLSPLRSWRELWHSESLTYANDYRDRNATQPAFCKPQKRTAFHWLSHLFVRDLDR
jgi:hypothetical protein